ncbi:MAG: AAA family ATPase [Opitutaceae bacterium]|nr:AAA family ATPase [Opitutaceae bacterium]
MDLVFLHGPAAAGKYTVGRELAALTGFELYHNHQVVDAVLQRHAFGTPDFVLLRDRLWRGHLAEAAAADRSLIFTFNPENSVPQAFVDWLFAALPRPGVRLRSVELTAPEAVIEDRLASAQRRQFRKLTDRALYRKLRDAGAFASPVIPRSDLRLDTGALAPAEAARRIVAEFGL